MGWTKALTDEQKRKLLVDHSDGIRVVDLIEKYGISKSTVYRILGDHNARMKHRHANKHRSTKSPKYPGRTLKPCGTNAAYARHIAKGERPCIPCADAHAAQQKEWKTKKEI